MILKEILNRRAVREYKTEPIPEEYINEIIKTGQFAPTARGNHAVEFLVIKNQATKEKIFDIVGQEFIKQAPVLIIPLMDKNKSVLPVQDLSVASENMFLQATALGLGSIWKNLRPEWEIKVKKLLGIPENYLAINIIPIGYSTEGLEPHNDEDFDERKIRQEKW